MKSEKSRTTPSSEGVAVLRRRFRVASRAGRGVLLAAALVLGTVASAGSQEARPGAAEAERAISQLRSPYCPGFMLQVCTSYQAALLRDSIYDLAAQGMKSDELVEWMISRHGEEWRAVPRRSGAGLLAWLIPPGMLILGLLGALWWLKVHQAGPTEAGPAVPEISDADREKLAGALRDWERSGEEDL